MVLTTLGLSLTLGCASSSGADSTDTGGTSGHAGTGATGTTGGTGGSGGSGGSGATATTGGKGSSTSSGGASAQSNLVGTFLVNMVQDDPSTNTVAHTTVLGKVYDAPQPSTIVLKLAKEQGGCQLLVPANAFCDPKCDSGVCTADNVCTPFANPQNLGELRLTGLTGGEITMTPQAFAYQNGPSLPNPPCVEGAAVTLSGAPFTIQSNCIANMVLTGTNPVPVSTGKPVKLTWTPPKDASQSKVWIHLDIAHHGGKKGEINCEVADTGSFEIPEPLVTQLVGLGLSGFPTVVVKRTATGLAPNAPLVSLSLESSVEWAVDTGVVSCTAPTDCAVGQTCQTDKTCK